MQKVNTADFSRFIKENWKGRPCQMCGNLDWKIQGAVFQLVPWGEDQVVMVAGTTNVPVVPVICTQCGNTVLVSAKIAGLVD
jgi:zona occludens toxin (predicted ATPase)